MRYEWAKYGMNGWNVWKELGMDGQNVVRMDEIWYEWTEYGMNGRNEE